MTFTYQAYCDHIDAIEAHIREPRPYREPSQADETIARIRPDVPAKMEQQGRQRLAAARITT